MLINASHLTASVAGEAKGKREPEEKQRERRTSARF